MQFEMTTPTDQALKSAIESLLFAWGEPLSIQRISKALDIKNTHAERLLNELIQAYESDERGITILEVDKHYQFCTKKENYKYIEVLCQTSKSRGLSNSALEVLTIIAYKQPITKLDIEQVRGVNSDAAIQSLMDRGLVDVVGKLEKIGRPQIYGTTQTFLKTFGLKQLSDLPPLDDFDAFRDFKNESEASYVADSDDEI